VRILFASSDFLPAIGGISLMVHGLAEACAGLGHDVAVIAPAVDGDPGPALPYRVFRETGVDPGRPGRLARLANDRRVVRWMRGIVEELRPDAVVVGFYKDYGQACLKLRDRLDIPVGGLVHGFDVASVLERGRIGPIARAAEAIGYPTARKRVLTYLTESDCLFANSTTTSAYVESKCGRRPITVGCGVPAAVVSVMARPDSARAARAAFRDRLGLKEAQTVGFLGRLVARKNVESILKSLTSMPGARALILGDGPARESLRALAAALGVDDRVVFAGAVDEKSKWDYLRAMDVFCLPSREIGGYNFEGFGIAFLEATVAGVPVVGGRSGGIPDVVKHEATGLLADPDDWREIASCLRRMLEDERLATRCVLAAQTEVRDRFNWPAIARRIIDELRKSRSKH
jgi:glycosyltransferase involved in cell wall biosynthesis